MHLKLIVIKMPDSFQYQFINERDILIRYLKNDIYCF